MSDTGRVPVVAAREVAKKYRCPVVIIFAIHDDGSKFCVTTYGATRPLCRHAADLGRQFSAAVLNGDVVPSKVEPTDIPAVPAVWDGARKGDE